MHVLYYQSPSGNFGDDLNASLWRELLPPACFEADDAILLGIGSIFRDDFLSESATADKRVFVLGSGAGTGPLPRRWPDPRWSILAVRGPLTARLIGRPEAAITDSAALLAVAPRLKPAAVKQNDVAFFPHFNSVPGSRWREACALAGFAFIDARRPPSEVLAMLARARLVVTEAMHGAIVADTLRIPWVPVVCSPAILPFKWVDWAKSLELDYRPIQLPPSSGWEALKHLKIRLFEPREARRDIAHDREDDLIEDFYRRYGDGLAVDGNKSGMRGSARTAVRGAVRWLDPVLTARAAEALQATARGRAYLSDDRIFANRVERLQESVERLRHALAA